MGTLTVKENLYFSASLRLPLSVPMKDKKRRVKRIIEELGLSECANTRVHCVYISVMISCDTSTMCLLPGWY